MKTCKLKFNLTFIIYNLQFYSNIHKKYKNIPRNKFMNFITNNIYWKFSSKNVKSLIDLNFDKSFFLTLFHAFPQIIPQECKNLNLNELINGINIQLRLNSFYKYSELILFMEFPKYNIYKSYEITITSKNYEIKPNDDIYLLYYDKFHYYENE